MDVLNNADQILLKIKQIDDLLDMLEDSATEKAIAATDLKREVAIAILKIKSGYVKEFTDPNTGEIIPIGNLAANLIPKVAEGLCWEYELKQIETESGYKSLVTKLESRRAQLNGFQSIFKAIQ